ncbi:secreted protein, partial [human gut metagenome]
MKRTLVLSAIALFGALQTFAAEPPRLIVQIVVGSMRAEDLNRYAANFGEGGFRRLTGELHDTVNGGWYAGLTADGN